MSFIKRIINFPSQAAMLFFAFADVRTPILLKIVFLFSMVYLVSPIDLIPDFIPVAGLVDDFIVVPALMAITLKQLPMEVLSDVRAKAKKRVRAVRLIFLLLAVGFLIALSILTWLIFF
jgi:uncharacterized membrane protein YkvA (DUF1232 family)